MVRGMAFLHCDKGAAAGRAYFPAAAQRAFNRRAISSRFDDFRAEVDRPVGRRRTEQFDRVIGSHGARNAVGAGLFHEVISRGPVAVAIEQCADDSAVQDAGKSFVLRLRLPFRHDRVALRKTANAQALRVGRPAAPAPIVRRVFFLE